MAASDGGPEDHSGKRTRAAAHELARYERLFAQRTHGMRSSAMREMMALTERPEVISLAGGLPDTSTFPAEVYAQLMAHVAEHDTARALQYGPTDGLRATMGCITEVMAAEGTHVDCDELLVTTGGQQVIDLVCKTLIDPGDVIVAEAPTYPGAVPTFSAYQAQVEQIEMDAQGMPIQALRELLDSLHAQGRRPKFIYTIPNFHNPGGVTMSLERRRELVALARERELLILEDNPYGLLRYEGEPLPTLYSLDAAQAGRGGASDFVIYLGTFSKILSPGVRIGWAVAPRPVLEKLNLGKQGADLCSSPVTQLFVAAYFAERDWRVYLEELKQLYRRRRDVMLAALTEHFGAQAHWSAPQGGLFIWATLGGGVDTTDLLAHSEGVAFVPGRAAYMDGRRGASSMRLNFAGIHEDDIREGIRRIGAVVAERAELYGTLTGATPAQPRRSARTAGAGEGPSTDAPASVADSATQPDRPSSPTQPNQSSTAQDAPLADVVELSRRPRRAAKGR
jgi:2-aminoadipate transaminase